MRGAGMVVESAKGECNLGQHEIAFRYAELVDKADEHCLFKLGAKEIAAQEGCSLTFMAKFDEREGNSCHVHLSLRDASDAPVFAGDRAHGFSAVFEHFLAGLVAYAAGVLPARRAQRQQLQAVRRTAPSPRRRCCGAWTTGPAPSGSSATDPRSASSRASPAATSTRTSRSPRWSRAACTASTRRSRCRPPATATPTGPTRRGCRRPSTRPPSSSIGSAMARAALGDEVVDHYVHAARVELGAFRSAVTDWERVRGFERL